MPHLSTLQWATLVLVFLSFFLILFSKAWWQNGPTYPSYSSSKKK
uniref:ATP synthase F0 subunit 8 n=1 Tax=Phascolosoma sp. MZK-2017 TaxID=1979532 RepID=A0A1W5YQA9_9ANNE|nr:ATP synthase F0 subunit 8 [Phascolosoma sp. MZK-2017]